MNDICVRSDEVLESGVKLKEYLDDAIASASDDYIKLTHKPDEIPKNEALELIQKYRNVLLCMKEICKNRKKF